jgi:hypothetical protein
VEWLLLLLVGGGGAWGARRLGRRRAAGRERQEELDGVRRLADEDVTVFGEQLTRLDAQVGGHSLDVDGQADYQRALDAYESAQRSVPRLRDPEEVTEVVETLATGRYALARVQARVAGIELPEQRVPCFFNPQHGPSTRDVEWTTTRHGTRVVPACAQDAARLAARQRPDVRTVTVDSRTVPYWDAGPAYRPYSRGYFPEAVTDLRGASVAWVFAEPLGHTGAGFDHLGHGGWSGGDFGGGDFGGGDGGGGDGGSF